MQASHSTLAQQLLEHLDRVREHKQSDMIEIPTDLVGKGPLYWHINEGEGSVTPGYPFEMQYNVQNEDAHYDPRHTP